MKLKKLILIAISGVLLLSSLFGCSKSSEDVVAKFEEVKYAVVSENNVSPDGFVYGLYENNTAFITGIKTPSEEVIIPDTVNEYKVVEIGADAFNGNETIRLLTLGKHVEKIGENAFSDCAALLRVDMTENVKSISGSAFYNCEALCEVRGATGLVYIDEAAFYNCNSMARFDFPKTVEVIGNEAFGACESLVEVKLPQKIKSVGYGAFSYCSSLSRIDLGGLTEIPEKAFLRCSSLGKVVIGEKITSMGVQAFRGCDKLKDVYIYEGIKTIGDSALAMCPSLEIRYSGSEDQWQKITVEKGNDFTNVNISYKQKLDSGK